MQDNDATRPRSLPMTMAITTIRLDYAALPAHFDLSRKDAIAETIEAELREDGIKAEASDVISHIKIELPTAQLARATAVLAEMALL
jgi:hypothetical protein